jgi:hypothetical protein
MTPQQPVGGAPPAAWLADPTGRHQYRYWDGQHWTEDVSTNGMASKDPLDAGTSAQTLLEAPLLNYSRVTPPPPAAPSHEIQNQFGLRLGTVAHTMGQEGAYPVAWMQMLEPDGTLVLSASNKMTMPADTLAFPVLVFDAQGTHTGMITQHPNPGVQSFEVRLGEQPVATAWGDAGRRNYRVVDPSGADIASLRRTSQQWGGNPKSTAFSLQLGGAPEDSLRRLLLALPLAVGLSFEQHVRKAGALFMDI